MSAPSSGSAGGSPTPGYYPDPSIPGYIRYWNGASWVPGTSRPAPAEGEAMPAPPPGAATAPSTAQPSAAEETGPVFFDEEENSGQVDGEAESDALAVRERGEVDVATADRDDPSRLHGNSPGSAAAWQADTAHQEGFGGEQDRRVSWGSVPPQREGAAPGSPAEARPWGDGAPAGAEQEGSEATPAGTERPAAHAAQPAVPADGTMAIRAMGTGGTAGEQSGTAAPDTGRADGTMAIRLDRGEPRPATGSPAAQPPATQGPADRAQPSAPSYGYPQQGAPGVPGQGGYGYPQQAGPATPGPQQSGYGYPQAGPAAQQGGYGYPQPGPAAQQSGYGYPQQSGPSAAQQGDAAEGVIPWKPPADNPFAQSAQEGRPASLGRRIAARLIDTVVLCALLAGVAVPLWGMAADHIDGKVEAAKQSGVQTTVYLLDGTTGGYLAIVIAVLLVVGLLYEALPTAKWGHTLGKKLCGLRVLDIEAHDTPEFASAIKRWLVYGVLGVLAVGVVNVLWCLVDRPWRQCWHDKAARTFVAEG
ncbi:RDD family protein [Streptomyces olivaceiscleroticus]|uniref:RDD family protein n=1 Tax=Streptomyces olivaceiscleroticus TaxID=68245 RepID=A0ABP3JJ13_9ACTN